MNKHIANGNPTFVIIILFLTGSLIQSSIYTSYPVLAVDAVHPYDTDCTESGNLALEGEAKRICCWTEEDVNSPTGESDYCQLCAWKIVLGPTSDKDELNYDCNPPEYEGPPLGGFPVPEQPPLADDTTNPLAGGGVKGQESNTTTPTDQNIAPGRGTVEQGRETPSSKGPRNPLDTILGFNEPPATVDDGSGQLPPDDTSERIINQQPSPTGYCVRDIVTTCVPCDPGLPGGDARCTSNNEWPPKTDLGVPTSKDIPGPPVMAPPEDQSGGIESPLLADEGTQPPTSTPESAELAPPDLVKCPMGQHWDEHLQICVPDPDPNPELDIDLGAEGSPGQSSPADEVTEQSSDEVEREPDDNNGNN
jgi:hypothetical protein